jgi:hypothetical protein
MMILSFLRRAHFLDAGLRRYVNKGEMDNNKIGLGGFPIYRFVSQPKK